MSASPAPTARRSCLSVPGSSAAMLAKAPLRGADEVIIDLEDAVAASAKDEARDTVVAALREPQWEGVSTSVRVNAPRTPWCHSDIVAMASAERGPGSIIVPKVESRGDLEFVDRLLDGAEAAAQTGRAPLRVQALIETAAGVARLDEIAGASPRLDALILGYADLSASLGRAAGRAPSWTPGARSRTRSSSPRARTTSRRSTGRTSASRSTRASPPPPSAPATWASTASGRSTPRRSRRSTSSSRPSRRGGRARAGGHRRARGGRARRRRRRRRARRADARRGRAGRRAARARARAAPDPVARAWRADRPAGSAGALGGERLAQRLEGGPARASSRARGGPSQCP